MHIVFVTPELATDANSSGGLASFTANMARIFSGNGHKVTILLSTVKELELDFDKNVNLENVYVRKSIWDIFDKVARICTAGRKEYSKKVRVFLIHIYRMISVRRKIKELNRKERIDIVHHSSASALAFSAGEKIPYVIRLSSFFSMWRAANLPVQNGKYEDNKLTVNEKLMIGALKKARYVISPSNLLADIGKEKWGINATVIESPFVLLKEMWNYEVYHSVIGNKKYIIHYGSLKYLKGTHIVAQIAKQFLALHPEMYLVLAGNSENMLNGNGETIKADELVKLEAGEFANRVIYAGRLVREQLYPLIQNSELCLLPSRIDNLSNACIEAMAMGKIVVATNGASFEQLIDDGVSGFLCERDNPESYLNAINEALEMSEEDREKMISKATERIRLLSPDVIYNKYLEFYQNVINEWKDK